MLPYFKIFERLEAVLRQWWLAWGIDERERSKQADIREILSDFLSWFLHVNFSEFFVYTSGKSIVTFMLYTLRLNYIEAFDELCKDMSCLHRYYCLQITILWKGPCQISNLEFFPEKFAIQKFFRGLDFTQTFIFTSNSTNKTNWIKWCRLVSKPKWRRSCIDKFAR